MIFVPLSSHITYESFLTKYSQLEVLKVVHSYDDPNWFFPTHFHCDQAEILFIAGGAGVYTARDCPFRVQRGDIVLFNPNVLHSVQSDSKNSLDVWSCSIRGFQLNGLAPNTLIPDNAPLLYHAGKQEDFIEKIYEELYQQGQNHPEGYGTVCDSLATVLLCLCVQIIRSSFHDNSSNQSFASEIISYLDEHYNEDISMDDLSEHFNISASHISHEVNRIYNTSPINYLINKRIQSAQWKLASTSLSLKEIALSVGYENPSYFSKLFRERVGVQPLTFRKRYSEIKA